MHIIETDINFHIKQYNIKIITFYVGCLEFVKVLYKEYNVNYTCVT